VSATIGGVRARPRRKRTRRRRLLTRAVPLVVVAIGAFAFGVYQSGAAGRAERHLVARYMTAWQRGDYRTMYGLLDTASRNRLTLSKFTAAYAQAAQTATAESVVPGRVGGRSGAAYPVAVRVRTREFGTLREMLDLPLSGHGSDARVHFSGTIVFPGLRGGERLTRLSELGARGTLLASNGVPLAQGAARTSPIPTVAGEIVGALGPIPPTDAARYAAMGYPANAQVGLTGLERIFQRRLVGMIGGTLLAGHRPLASVAPSPGQTVRTTINPAIEEAAISALAGRYAGMTVMDPRTGAILALAGIAFSSVQPPGSTMKIVTASAALQAGLVKLGSTFPIATNTTIDGYTMQNAGGEACGGTLLNAFAVSCNSVFAPLGVQVGAQRLVGMAERFGFNKPTQIAGALTSTIPSAATIGSALSVGSSAIGQGKVQASSLEMTDVAATIAMGGRRPIPTLLAGGRPRFVPVISRGVANLVQRMMVAVVAYGTGVPAQISGVEVAGKTGTAELVDTTAPSTDPNAPPADSPKNTDSWFVGYAPVGHPRLVLGALFPSAGAGAATAAPAVREAMAASLPVYR
jgi:cell division protein FtsI/penicillin-binding protein 2